MIQVCGLAELVVLRRPHLVLADVGDDDGRAVGRSRQGLHDVRGEQRPVVGRARVRLAVEYLAAAIWSSQSAGRGLDWGSRTLAARRAGRRRWPTSTGTFLLNSPGSMSTWILRAVARIAEIAGHAIVEAHAEGENQIRALHGVVDPRLAVHPHHAEVQRMVRRQARRCPAA